MTLTGASTSNQIPTERHRHFSLFDWQSNPIHGILTQGDKRIVRKRSLHDRKWDRHSARYTDLQLSLCQWDQELWNKWRVRKISSSCPSLWWPEQKLDTHPIADHTVSQPADHIGISTNTHEHQGSCTLFPRHHAGLRPISDNSQSRFLHSSSTRPWPTTWIHPTSP